MKIGFFDSGLGGLLILKHVAKQLSQYDYEYYGDTAHLPYGDRSEDEIFTLTKAGMEHLFARECVLVIVACNTASAETLRRLQDEWLPYQYPDRRILGVIIPMIETVEESGLEHVLLVATKRTVDSNKYQRELEKKTSSISLTQVATPVLVPLIEAGALADAAAALVPILEMHCKQGGGGVVLGCTHYGLLTEALRAHFGEVYAIMSQHEIIPSKLALYLERHPELCDRLSTTGKRNIYLTANRTDYDRFIASILDGRLVMEE